MLYTVFFLLRFRSLLIHLMSRKGEVAGLFPRDDHFGLLGDSSVQDKLGAVVGVLQVALYAVCIIVIHGTVKFVTGLAPSSPPSLQSVARPNLLVVTSRSGSSAALDLLVEVFDERGESWYVGDNNTQVVFDG